MKSLLTFFEPYAFSPAVLALCLGGLVFYIRGLWQTRVRSIGFGRAFSFIVGVLGIYVVMQTRFDYWAQHMFYVHRIQHLVLHHVSPFLIALSAPQAALESGTPALLRRPLTAFWRHPATQAVYKAVQQPLVASFLFVVLIYVWLIPSIHFYAMLSWPLYKLMNWSMAVDGLLFWWMAFNVHPSTTRPGPFYGLRIAMLFAITLPQIAIGAYIALCGKPLYSIYAVCGRIWPLAPATDQQLGGLITWIPASMMSLFGMLVVLHKWFSSEKRRNEDTGEDNNALQTA